MATYTGPLWRGGESTTATVRVEHGRVVSETDEEGHGTPAVILDGLHNYHTHLGDAFLSGARIPRRLEDAVRPGAGFKHRMLAKADRTTILNGIRRALSDHAQAGTRSLLDFREQGVLGLRIARQAERDAAPDVPDLRLLGRPTRSPVAASELETLLEHSDGLGLPSITDVPADDLERIARASRREKLPLAIHASERRREDVARTLSYAPRLLVHGCAWTSVDARRVAEADVPVALCPSSNAYFGLKAPVRLLHRNRVRFHFGTDNAMLGATDLVAEAAIAKRLAPDVADDVLLRALTTPPEKSISARPIDPNQKAPSRLVILARRKARVAWKVRPTVARR